MRVTALALVLAGAFGCVSASVLVDPKPVPAASSADLTRKAIARACLRTGFSVDAELPGESHCTVHQNEWRISVAVKYDAEHAQVHYLDSLNMNYSPNHGRPMIRSSYNHWVQDLSDAVEHEARLITADENPDALLGPPVAAPAQEAAKPAP
jgi:hypothetical protein